MKENTKILVVDDQEGMRETLGDILKDEGYEVELAKDGFIAIQKVKEDAFDIIFMDIKMPGINGVETFREIKKITPEAAVIMMTAYAVEDLVKEAIREGAYACVYKPFEVEKIMSIIEEALKEKAQKKMLVLVVDDQLEARETLKDVLEERYRVVTAKDGRAAIESVKKEAPDLILMDIVLPGINGVEAFREIKKINPEIPVLMMTGYAVDDLIKEAVEEGALGCLRKPLDIDKVTDAIKKALEAKGMVLSQEKLRELARVLVVDDEEVVRGLLQDSLKDEGYKVDVAEDGYKAIKKIKEMLFNIILMDVKMPGIDGVETFREVKKLDPKAAVIMMTGYSVEDLVREAAGMGAYTCLYKPFDIELVIATIEEALKNKKRATGD